MRMKYNHLIRYGILIYMYFSRCVYRVKMLSNATKLNESGELFHKVMQCLCNSQGCKSFVFPFVRIVLRSAHILDNLSLFISAIIEICSSMSK